MHAHHTHQEILNQNDIGFVAQCQSCYSIQFSIGNLFYRVEESEFRKLIAALRRIEKRLSYLLLETPVGERLLFSTKDNSVLLSLSQDEYYLTLSLLEGALVLLDAQQLIYGPEEE